MQHRRAAFGNPEDIRREIAELRAKRDTLTQRHQLRERKNVASRLAMLEETLETLPRQIERFDISVKPYMEKLHALRQKKTQARLFSQSQSGQFDAEHALLQEYLAMFETDAEVDIIARQADVCVKCNSRMHLMSEDAILICKNCGTTERFVDSIQAHTSYGDDNSSCCSNYSYLRLGHFEEWLKKSQGTESTEVSEELIERIMEDLYTHGIRKISNIDRLN